jgi:hypothetical protein
VNLQNIKKEALFIQRIRCVELYFVNCCETECIIYSLISYHMRAACPTLHHPFQYPNVSGYEETFLKDLLAVRYGFFQHCADEP